MEEKKGFTLIELLVVIAIIALLLSILTPSLKKAKVAAERIVCSAHLKDMGTLIHLYSADNEDRVVSNSAYSKRWYNLLGDYYGAIHATSGAPGSMYDIEIFKCPTEWRRHEKVLNAGNSGGGNPLSIAATSMWGYNGFFSCPGTLDSNGRLIPSAPFKRFWYSRLSRIKISSDCPIFYEKSSDWSARLTSGNANFNGYPSMLMYAYGWDASNPRSRADSAAGPAPIHGKNINVLFADGHAGGQGLWIYKDTMNAAKPPEYYRRQFHPTKSKNWKDLTGDGW